MNHHETVVIRCNNIGARCGDVCIWGSDVGDRAEVIRCDDIGARCGDVGARHSDDGDRAELLTISARSYRRYRRGVSGDIGDCGVGITPQMCNRVTNLGDMSTFSKPGLTHLHCRNNHGIVVNLNFVTVLYLELLIWTV